MDGAPPVANETRSEHVGTHLVPCAIPQPYALGNLGNIKNQVDLISIKFDLIFDVTEVPWR